MFLEKLILDLKALAAACIRYLEFKSAGNKDQAEQIQLLSDDLLLRRWLWKFVIIGALVCFLLMPILLSALSKFIALIIMQALWFLLHMAMGIVLLALILAIYITVHKSK